MAVKEDAVLGRRVAAGNLNQDHRRTFWQAHHLQRRTGQGTELALRPAGKEVDRAVHMAVCCPIRIEGRRFIGNADVVDEGRDDLVLPHAIDEG